jgi:excisionase family DNA binding protein
MLNQYQDIMSVPDVAESLSIGKNRVYELLGNGDLKGFRIGRVWKIPKEALQEYILTQSCLK